MLAAEDLQMRKVCAELNPKVLMNEQTTECRTVCKEMIQR